MLLFVMTSEKFVVVLPNTDIQGARFIANEIINQFEKQGFPTRNLRRE